MGMFFHDRGEAPPERPDDPAVRRANLRRIGPLFRVYWRRLSLLLGLIVVSAGLGVLPAFLLRRVLVAIEAHDKRAVSMNAGGMIVIAIIAGALGVVQTLLSNQVGQRVMHDLRAAVFRHLQRLSLAFFTRTRTGEVQSRINNDIGGVQNVVTNTATSITSSLTSFSVMPAAVYWLGGTVFSHSISIATIVAFTTLQTRLFFPVGSLLGVGLDIQTSLALFDRIFEYLDTPVDIAERENPVEDAAAGDVVYDRVWFRYDEDAWTLQDVSVTVPAVTTTALVGETGAGK